jgi:predicted acetyltransferase
VTETTIRRMPLDDMLDVLFPLTQYAFHPSPPFRDREPWEEMIREREEAIYLALFEDDTPVATVAGSAMTQRVRGNLYDAAAVWGVVTDPAARRRGYCRRLMRDLLTAQREEGQLLSCLYPFRASFYERLGYVKFPLPLKVRFDPAALQPLLKKDLGGRVERMLIGEGYTVYRDYLRRLQERTHGMALFVQGEEERASRENRAWLALARVDGEVVGLILYRTEGEDVTQFTMRGHRFYYDTSRAKYLLLQWIARHVDQVSEVELWLSPDQHPETWLADLHVSAESPPRSPMGRVVDVAKLGGMATGPGRFAARVRDPFCPWNEGNAAAWAFETVDGRLQVHPTGEPDCDLTIQALAALVYGTHDPGDFRFRGWGDPTAEVQATMRTMFPRRLPYLHEYF